MVQTVTPEEIIARCRAIAEFSEQPGCTTRTFLSSPMREVHRTLRTSMESLGMSVSVDSAGNLRGHREGTHPDAPRLLIGSHLDTVPNAGAFDGILGVVLAIALIESLGGRRLPFAVEIVGFSEEEGVRFGVPFIGSRALVGTVDAALLDKKDARGITVAQAIREFGLDPTRIPDAAVRDRAALGYLEFHIEQGPVLDELNLPLGVVDGIAGQTQARVSFRGRANHAGTTPMHLRHDAVAAAAEWILAVEQEARATQGLVATVGQIEALPGASNVIAGEARASLDVRHADDAQRVAAADRILSVALDISQRRGLAFDSTSKEQRSAVCDPALTQVMQKAVESAGFPVQRMISGAGHDAMILAQKMPIAMLFLRSPAGISHHPDESVLPQDVSAALQTGLCFLKNLEEQFA